MRPCWCVGDGAWLWWKIWQKAGGLPRFLEATESNFCGQPHSGANRVDLPHLNGPDPAHVTPSGTPLGDEVIYGADLPETHRLLSLQAPSITPKFPQEAPYTVIFSCVWPHSFSLLTSFSTSAHLLKFFTIWLREFGFRVNSFLSGTPSRLLAN